MKQLYNVSSVVVNPSPVISSPSSVGTLQGGRMLEGEQAGITCSPQVATFSSIDTLHLSLWLSFSNSDLLDKLVIARDQCRELELDKIPFQYFGTDFNVHRTGRRHFPFHLSSADTHIFFNRRASDDAFPTCIIEIGSLSCWTPGPFEIFKKISTFFEFMDIQIFKHNVSRLDLAADFINIKYSDLGLANPEQWICRANTFSSHYTGRSPSGISLGKGNFMLRIYDKLLELQVKQSTSKKSFFESIWGEDPSHVTRVEFQLRREALKTLNIGIDQKTGEILKAENISDIESAQDSIWQYCCQHWARHASEPVDFENKHQSRAVNSAFWDLVQAVTFKKFSGASLRTKKKRHFVNIKALEKQGAGCLLAVAACFMKSSDNLQEAIQHSVDSLKKTLRSFYLDRSEEFERKVQTIQNINRPVFA